MKSKKIIMMLLLFFVVVSTGCHTYQQQCAAYSYEENQQDAETNEENS